MRWCLTLAAALGLVVLSGARAGGPEEQYLVACNLIHEADSMASGPRATEALTKYTEAKATLQRLQKDFPDWNLDIVRYRLGYLTNKLASLPANSARAAASGSVTPSVPPADWEVQIATLKEQVQQLRADKALLEAKLKEALSVQPAASDPRELVKVQSRIEIVEKENALLAATLAQVRATPAFAGGFSPIESIAPAADLEALRRAEREKLEALGRGGPATNALTARTNRVVRVIRP
jgi:hypothetical protein